MKTLRELLEDVAAGRETIEQAIREITETWQYELAQAYQAGVDSLNYTEGE